MTQAIMQAAIEAMKAAVQAMADTAGLAKRSNVAVTALDTSIRSKRPAQKQLISNCKMQDKYNKLLNFETEINRYIYDPS